MTQVFRRGLVMFADRLAPAQVDAHFGWILQLRQNGEVEVPYADRNELLRRLWSMRSVPDLSAPEGLQSAEVRVAPVGHLRVAPPKYPRDEDLEVDVRFEYDGTEFPSHQTSAGAYDEAGGRVVVRDPAAEERLLRRLREVGVRIAPFSPTG